MKLISEKEIEENGKKIIGVFKTCPLLSAFKVGSRFAEEKIIHLLIEFADYCQTFELYGSNYCPVKKTTEQLLEKFLKSKGF